MILSHIEIQLPALLDENSPIHKFLQKRGPGIHHICLEVEDINIAIKELKELKIQTINESPTIGAEGYKIVFIHPKFTGGVLVELAEKPI